MSESSARSANRTGLAGGLWIAAGVVYLTAEAIAASGYSGYSYADNYISDLGISVPGEFDGRVVDSQLAEAMNAGFLVEGLLLFLGALLLLPLLRRGWTKGAFIALAGAHFAGGVLLAFFESSQQSVDAGLSGFHVGGAALAIIGGNLLFLLAGARPLRPVVGKAVATVLVLLGTIGLVCLVMLRVADASGGVLLVPEGIWERGAVYPITLAEIVAGVALVLAARSERLSRRSIS